MLAFNTSYGYDKISLKIVSKYLLLDKLPLSLQEKSIMIIISDEKDKEVKLVKGDKVTLYIPDLVIFTFLVVVFSHLHSSLSVLTQYS